MSATYTDELPQNLPAELAALGAPVQTFAPAAGQVSALKLANCIGAAVSALMLFGMATFCFTMHHSPFSAKPWPPGVALGIALSCAVLGSVCLCAAVHYGGREREASPRTYLLYDHALVEQLPDRHRILPWARLGQGQQRGHLWARAYTFPVDGDEPVTFDWKTANSAALARAITRATIVHRVADASGQTLDALRTGVAAPFFLARSADFVYRVSPVGNCLLFLKIIQGGVRCTPGMGGLVAATMYALESWHKEKLRAVLAKLASADPYQLLQATGEYEQSFVIARADVRAVHFKLPGLARSDSAFAGRLELDHSADVPVGYVLETAEDACKAVVELGQLFPDTASVERI